MSIIVRIGSVQGLGTSMTSGTEVQLSPQDDDSVEIPPPPDEICQRPTSYATCYGLPYQDHNYNAPPPPTPPHSPIPSPVKILNGHVEIEEVVTTTTSSTNTASVVIPKDDRFDDSVTRCVCQFQHDDGYMICCDKCSVWQHIDCMGIDRNNIPESFFCELCQPRDIDKERARLIQMRKREELTGGWDTSATDTDPDEAANHLASLKKKTLTNAKGKIVKPRRISRAKEKNSPKKILIKKEKRVTKREKENFGKELNKKPKVKIAKESIQKSPKIVKKRRNTSVSVSGENGDPWNSLLSPWVDSYEEAKENQYSAGMRDLLSLSKTNGVLSEGLVTEKLRDQLCTVTEVKPNRKGLVAKEQLHQGQAVIEFKGNVMLKEHIDTENFMKKFHPFVLFYSKFENIDLCVDASAYGGEARFVRRSCSSNAEIQHVIEKCNIHFVIFAKKDIPPGGEITIPFDYNYKECSFNVECACLKAACPVSRASKKTRISQNREPKQCVPASTPAPVAVPPPVLPVKEKKRTRRFSAPERESTRTKTSRFPPKSPATPVASPVKQTLENRKAVSLEEPSPVKKEVVEEKQNLGLTDDQKGAALQSADTLGMSESELEAAERCKKMTREERKMEAIMKAFEKLAKREERRKEALARLETTKKPDGKDEEIPPVPTPIKEEPEEKPKPESPVKSTPPKGKKNKKHAKRRSRVNSAAAAIEVVSTDENSNTGSMPGTPGPAPASADVASPNAAGFKFHKTKKHLFNEWMSEKGTDGKLVPTTVSMAAFAIGKTEPLEVNVDETMFVTCLPSPRNAMEHIPRRNSQSAGSVPPPVVVQQPKSSNEHSIGSAKKRWLRQAMFETGPPSDSGSASPVHGGASPNPSTCLPSPGGSPPTDFVTPLKKRRLARESMSQEQPTTPNPSTPSSSLLPTDGSIDAASGAVPGSPQTDLEDIQNKNGIRPLVSQQSAVALEEKSENVCYPPAKRQRRESSHRESTDVDSDASESLMPLHPVPQKIVDKDSDLAETSISSSEKDSSLCEVADSSADSSGIEVDVGVCNAHKEVDRKEVDISTGADSMEIQEVCASNSESKCVPVERGPGEQDKTLDHRGECFVTCDSQHIESTVQSLGDPEIGTTASVCCPEYKDSGEVSGSQGFDVCQLTELSNVVDMASPNAGETANTDKLQTAETNCSDYNSLHSTDTDSHFSQLQCTTDGQVNKIKPAETDCRASDSHDNVCDSASKCDAGAVVCDENLFDASPPPPTPQHSSEESLCSVSSTVNKVESLQAHVSGTTDAESCAVPDSQTGPCEVSTGYKHFVDHDSAINSDDFSAVSSSTSHHDGDPGIWLEPAEVMTESENGCINPPLPSEPPPPPPPEEEDTPPPLPPSPPPPPPPDPPTKKKVSLLEYRKRLKEKVKEPSGGTSPEVTTPPPPPLPYQSHHQYPPLSKIKPTRSVPDAPSLAPLPLFEGTSPAKKGVNISPQKKEKKKKPEVRKPLSLTERLKQEFGLDDTEEEVTKPAEEEGQLSPEIPPPPPSAPHPSHLKSRSGLLPHPSSPASSSTHLSHSSPQAASGGPGLLPHPVPTNSVPKMTLGAYSSLKASGAAQPRGISPVPMANGPALRNFPLLNGTTAVQQQQTPLAVPSSVAAPVPPPGSVPTPVPPPPPKPAFHMNISSTNNQYATPSQTSNMSSPAAFSSLGAGFSSSSAKTPGTPPNQQQSSVQYVAQVQARHETNIGTNIGQKFEYNHGLNAKPVRSPPPPSWNKGSSSHRQPPLPSHIQGTTSKKDKGYHSPLASYPSSTNHY